MEAENITVILENRFEQILRKIYSKFIRNVVQVEMTVWKNLSTKSSYKQTYNCFKKRSIELFQTICLMYGDMIKFAVDLFIIT